MSDQDMEDVSKINLELEPLHEQCTKTEVKPRLVWGRKIEYLLSLLGYTFGLGTVWRFPYLCVRNGGVAFVLPFVFFTVLSGMPMYFIELAVGQFSGQSPSVLWRNICPLLRGIGFSPIIIASICALYYGAVLSWILCYLVYSFFPVQPWSTCDNSWNTENCISSRTLLRPTNWTSHEQKGISVLSNSSKALQFYPTAANEFWRFRILKQSSGVEVWGELQWHLVLALFGAYTLSFLCIIKGVRSVGKVAYVTATLPFLLITVILVRSLSLDGAVEGLLHFVQADFSKLLHTQVWVEAAVQVFYSLGAAWGVLITMASYNKFNNQCFSDAVIVCAADVFSSILCTLPVYSIIGFLAHESGLTFEDIAEAGPGLLFQTYPEALMRLPFPQVWSILFFIMLLTVGIDSMFSMLETLVTGFADLFPSSLGKRKINVVLVSFVACMLLGLVFTSEAGVYVYQILDWYTAIVTVFLVSFFQCLILGYIYGAERFSRDIELMLGRPLPFYIRISLCILTPLIMLLALTMTLMNYQPPAYKGYKYPDYIEGIGIVLALLSIIPIPLFAVTEFMGTQGSFLQRVKKLTKPLPAWGPNSEDVKCYYTKYHNKGTFAKKLKENIFGVSK